MNWYSQHKDDLFDFNKELLRCYKSDVDILLKCCLKFRKMFVEITTRDETKGIDPFDKCMTIVYVCNVVCKTLYLESERVGIIPPHGYRPQQKQSIKQCIGLGIFSNVMTSTFNTLLMEEKNR